MVDKHDDELMSWAGRGYPPALERVRARLRRDGQWDRIDVGRGWWPLLVRLDERLAQVVDWYGAERIREVDGLLEFYASSTPDSITFTDLVWEAMLEAAHTCTGCGRPGARRHDGSGRFFTRCDEHARPLDESERALLARAGVPPVAVAEWEIVEPVATHRAASEIFETSISRTHLSAEDVAVILGMNTDEVYQLYLNGDLLGARRDDAKVVYPLWQLHDGARIPGLSKVTWRVNYAWNAMDARAVMIRPNEDLEGMSPVEWLVARYPVAAVTALLLSYEYEGMPGPALASESSTTPADSQSQENPGDGDEGKEMDHAERLWREVRGRLEELLGPSELAAALGAYAVDNQDRLRVAEVRRIRVEYGRSQDPSAEALFPLLRTQEGDDDASVT